jgi:hypothetical protein
MTLEFCFKQQGQDVHISRALITLGSSPTLRNGSTRNDPPSISPTSKSLVGVARMDAELWNVRRYVGRSLERNIMALLNIVE